MNKGTKLRIHIITAKAALKFGSEAWALKNREEQRFEAAQMEFLRNLLGKTKLDKEKNQCIRQKTGAEKKVKEIKQYKKKWLQHVQMLDTNRLPKHATQYKSKDEGTQDDRGRDRGTNFILRIKEQEKRLTLQEYDDDDDDDITNVVFSNDIRTFEIHIQNYNSQYKQTTT